MSNICKIIFLIFLVFVAPYSFSEELKICEEGINKCKPLISSPEKYSKCMRLMCYDYYSEEAKKEDDSKFYFKYLNTQETKPKTGKELSENVSTCEYGLRKCDALYKNPEYYWECMSDSCKNPDNNAKADCQQGRNVCVDRQKIYNDCMSLTCGDPSATFDSCPASQQACTASLRAYWQCVYNICLGSVDKYIKPATTKKFMIIVDSKGIKRRIQVDKPTPTLANVPAWYVNPPKGVDPEEWIRETPQKFLLIGNPSEYMQCIIPTAILDCKQNDIRSCRCSDGTYPIMLNGTPSPYWNSR